MLSYNNYSKKFVKKSSKLLNNISSQNSFLLDSLISDLYSHLHNLVPEKIAFSAAINSRDTFEYFLDYSVEEVKLILNNNNNAWSLYYKVFPSYLDPKQNFKKNENISYIDRIVVNLKDFFINNVKKNYN